MTVGQRAPRPRPAAEWFETPEGRQAARFYAVRLRIGIRLLESGEAARAPRRWLEWVRPVPLPGVPALTLRALEAAVGAARQHLRDGDGWLAVEALRRAIVWAGSPDSPPLLPSRPAPAEMAPWLLEQEVPIPRALLGRRRAPEQISELTVLEWVGAPGQEQQAARVQFTAVARRCRVRVRGMLRFASRSATEWKPLGFDVTAVERVWWWSRGAGA